MQARVQLLLLTQELTLLLLLTRCEAFVSSIKIYPDPNNTTGQPIAEADLTGSHGSPCTHSSELEADLRQLREEQTNSSLLVADRLDALRQLLTYNATHPLDALLLGKLESLERQLEQRSDVSPGAQQTWNRQSGAGSALSARPTSDVASYQLVKDELMQLKSRVESQRIDHEAQKLQLETQRLQMESHRLEMESQKLQLESQRLELEKLRQQKSVEVGTSYVRWGRTTCDGDATTLYKGYASGSKHDLRGGASNLLCLHENPQWNRTISGVQNNGLIHGVEYEVFDNQNNIFSKDNNGGHPLGDHPAACALCHVPNRSTRIMIPAKRDCPSGFTKEYNGYIMAGHHGHHRLSYDCWDDAPETVPGASAQNHALIYPTEVVCGSLPCSKFHNGFELTCVVCTK